MKKNIDMMIAILLSLVLWIFFKLGMFVQFENISFLVVFYIILFVLGIKFLFQNTSFSFRLFFNYLLWSGIFLFLSLTMNYYYGKIFSSIELLSEDNTSGLLNNALGISAVLGIVIILNLYLLFMQFSLTYILSSSKFKVNMIPIVSLLYVVKGGYRFLYSFIFALPVIILGMIASQLFLFFDIGVFIFILTIHIWIMKMYSIPFQSKKIIHNRVPSSVKKITRVCIDIFLVLWLVLVIITLFIEPHRIDNVIITVILFVIYMYVQRTIVGDVLSWIFTILILWMFSLFIVIFTYALSLRGFLDLIF